MKALTVCQPYATHLISGIPGRPIKRVENRTWYCPHRGPLVIHAGKSKDWFERPEDIKLPRGVILGVVDMIDCVNIDDYILRYDKANRDVHANGPYCWVMRNPRALAKPIEWRGAQGLFSIPDEHLLDLIDTPLTHFGV